MPIYIGVNGITRKITNGYVGVSGKARIIYNEEEEAQINALPAGYIPYKYLYDNTGVGGVTIPITVNTYTQIICDFQASRTDFTSPIFYRPLSSGSEIRYAAYIDNTGKLYIEKGSLIKTISIQTNTSYTLNLTKNSSGDSYLNSTLLFSGMDSNVNSNQLRLFNNTTGTGIYKGSSKVIYIKGFYAYDLFNQKELVNLRPCTNGTYFGMYDLVSNTFYKDEDNPDYLQCSNTIL